MRTVRALTSAPFGVNLLVPGSPDVDRAEVEAYTAALRTEAGRYGVDLGQARYDDDDWDAKLAELREQPPAAVSFTFGCPPTTVMDALRTLGSEVWVTVTHPDEAGIALAAGADVLVLQGSEAGGHRASFKDGDEGEQFGVLALLRLVAEETTAPLVAAGGIADVRAWPPSSQREQAPRNSAPRSCSRTRRART